jgi:flagellar protein FliL
MADQDNAAANSQKNPLVAVLLVVNIVAMATIAFMQYQFMKLEASRPSLSALLKDEGTRSPEAEGEAKNTEVIKKENLLTLESMTINLSQGDGPRRHAVLEAVLKLSGDAKREEFEARRPQIRDTIISIVNSKRPEDLLKKEGKQFLKEEIKASINSFLVDGVVEDIFYINFMIN